MENKEAEEKLKEFELLTQAKKNEVQKLDNKLKEKYGSNHENPYHWHYWRKLDFFEGVGGLIALVIIVTLLLIGFVIGKLF